MKRWFPCLAGLVFALFGFVGRANAVLMLFDNGAPTGGVGHWISYKPDGIRPRIADDFVLPTDSAVTGVTFWTVESGDWDGVLEYYVFEDAGGLPSLTAKDSGNAVNISRQQTGSFTIGPQYRYSFNFEQPAFISGNQAHWLGLFVGTDTVNEGIFWETTAIGFSSKIVRAEFLAGAPIWNPIGVSGQNQAAFQLSGNPVPEPASIAMLGMGAVCMLGYGWRRKRNE